MNVFFKGYVAAGFGVMKAKVDEDMEVKRLNLLVDIIWLTLVTGIS